MNTKEKMELVHGVVQELLKLYQAFDEELPQLVHVCSNSELKKTSPGKLLFSRILHRRKEHAERTKSYLRIERIAR